MRTRTAILIAAAGVMLSLCLGLFGGAAAGYYISNYAPRSASSLALPLQGQSIQPRRSRPITPQQTQPNQTLPDQSQPDQTQPQQTLPRLPGQFRGFGLNGALVMEVSANSPAEKAG